MMTSKDGVIQTSDGATSMRGEKPRERNNPVEFIAHPSIVHVDSHKILSRTCLSFASIIQARIRVKLGCDTRISISKERNETPEKGSSRCDGEMAVGY